MAKADGGEKYLKVCLLTMYMSGVFTKHPPEKLEYWRQYRRDNAAKCREQRRQWREANRDRIRICARRSYYRRASREGQGDAMHSMFGFFTKIESTLMKIFESLQAAAKGSFY